MWRYKVYQDSRKNHTRKRKFVETKIINEDEKFIKRSGYKRCVVIEINYNNTNNDNIKTTTAKKKRKKVNYEKTISRENSHRVYVINAITNNQMVGALW